MEWLGDDEVTNMNEQTRNALEWFFGAPGRIIAVLTAAWICRIIGSRAITRPVIRLD